MKKQNDVRHFTVYKTPEESPGYLLWRVSTQWRSSIEATLKPLDLTHPQFVVLAVTGWLTQDGAIVSQIEISRAAALDPNTTSQVIRALEAKELIERIQTRDERSKNPIMTKKGRARLAQALPAVEQADTQFFNALNKKESEQIVTLFQKLLQAQRL